MIPPARNCPPPIRWNPRERAVTLGVRGLLRDRSISSIELPFKSIAGETYRWSRGTDPSVYLQDGVTLSGSSLSGTSDATLRISNFSEEDEDTYFLFVGTPPEPVGSVVVYVDRDVPTILEEPANQEVCAGTSAVFRVLASNATSFVWRLNGNVLSNGPLSGGGGTASGATTNTLTISNVSAAAAGTLTCEIRATAEPNFTRMTTLAVSANAVPPVVQTQPSLITGPRAGTKYLHVAATGSNPDAVLAYQWHRNGIPLDDDGRIFGSKWHTLEIDNASSADQGVYDCLISQACAATMSEGLTLATCPGDFNGDNQVDDADFVLFATAYNVLDCTDPTMPAGCPADLNGDDFVDDSDFVTFAAAYNELICP
jgi:hypothetical protein